MARVRDNWERLVRATLKREQLRIAGQGHGQTSSAIAGAVPPSLAQTTNIEAILQAADEIQSADLNIARILGEQAYSMAYNLDPNSAGSGVLQFKTGLMCVFKLKYAKEGGVRIDRNRDIENLWEFYQCYKRRYRVDDIQREEQRLQESGTFSSNLGESLEMRKETANLKALVEVMEALSKDADPNGVGGLIMEELRKIKKSGATLSAEVIPYNIVPLEATSLTNPIRFFPEASDVMMMDRAVPEGLLRSTPPEEKHHDFFIFTFSLLAWVCVYLLNELKSLGAKYGLLQMLRMLAIAHVLRFVQLGKSKVPLAYYLQKVLKFDDLPITAAISASYTIFRIFPSPKLIVLLLALLVLFLQIVFVSPKRTELTQDIISPTQGSSSNTDQQNSIDIQVDHFATILLAVICVDLAVELEKLKGPYYVFSMVFVIAARHMPYILGRNLQENNVPLAFYLRKVLLHYELPTTAAINVLYIIFITFSYTLFFVLCMELILLAILTDKREELKQDISSTQASSTNTNFLSINQQSLDAANNFNNFNTEAVHQLDLGKWKEGKDIGHGQYGRVFVYENSENPAEKRAVKRLNIFADGTNESALWEVEIISKLKPHPNIVKYYGHDMDEQGHINLHMEYVEQGSLANYMKERGRLAEHVIQDFTSQILSGLSHLHHHRIVHRDIKPENLLVDTKGSKDIIKLVDFGFSKELANSMGQHTFGGTLCFMAPEIFGRKGYERSIDASAADIWSLGCVITEMFTRDFIKKWLIENMENPPIPEGLSKMGKDFLKRCLQGNPVDRPSAEILLDDPFVAQTSTLMEESKRIHVCD